MSSYVANMRHVLKKAQLFIRFLAKLSRLLPFRAACGKVAARLIGAFSAEGFIRVKMRILDGGGPKRKFIMGNGIKPMRG
jgi:hypothetical protein